MRLAYLILTHENPVHLKRLLKALQPGGDIFIHTTAQSSLNPNDFAGKNIFPISKRIKTYRAGYSITSAICQLIKTAQSHGNYDRLTLLSESDYPVRSQSFIQSFFSANPETNFINIVRMPGNGKSFDRMRYHHFETAESLNWLIGMLTFGFQYTLKKFGIKRNLPEPYDKYELYGGSAWWSFSGEFANYLLDFLDANREFVDFYRYTWAPDEMLFHTIIMNSPFRKSVRPSCTFKEWDFQTGHPMIIQERHIPLLAKDWVDWDYGRFQPLFARKFDKNSGEVVQLINDLLIKPQSIDAN